MGYQDTIATAVSAITEQADTYTEFKFDFEYRIEGVNPDTINIVFTSSGDGGNLMARWAAHWL